ncbi:MAG: rhomboid family intramembrane serine protease [Clostridiales bacterium]|jgi:membrane associated rhomboid family serine protease|nr:rhomboid family intramembrane serine protease [Clostridiales bacterium]
MFITNAFKKIQYNSPMILTYALLSLVVAVVGYLTQGASTALLFSVYRAPLTDPLTYPRLIGHVLGHTDLNHYFSNFLLILLIGPMLEEKYGSVPMLIMILITSLATGLIFLLVSNETRLLGASGIVFMLILLSSFVNVKRGKIPLTLILVIIAYIGREAYQGFTAKDNISHLTHVIGGLCGAVLGFFINAHRMGADAQVKTEESV